MTGSVWQRLTILLALLLLAACGGAPGATPAGTNVTATAGSTGRATTVAAPTAVAANATVTRTAAATNATATRTTAPANATVTRTAAAVNTTAVPAGAAGGTLTIYSARKEELMKPLVDAFQRATGIKVTLLNAAPAELELRIEREASRPQADVFFTTDAASAERLRQKGLLQPYQSPNAARIPAEFKAADGTWTGTIGRARTIMYNTNLAKPEDAPKSVFDLTDPKYRGRVAISAITEGGTTLWLASLLQERGEEFTVKYINDLRANGLRVLANSTEVRKEVGGGGVAYGLVNHYYYVFEQKEGKPVGLIYPDQDQGQMGTLVTPLAVSIVKGVRNEDAARRFVDFALSAEGQLPLTTQEAEFPLVPGVSLGEASVPGVRPIDQIKRPTTDFTKLAGFERRAVELFGPILVPGAR